jgi:seryl-tRNA synthetase
MHDIRALRESPDRYVDGWTARGMAEAAGVVAELLGLDQGLRAAQTLFQDAQARRNEASKLIGQAKGRKDEAEAQRLMAEVEALKTTLAEQDEVQKDLSQRLHDRLAALPNLAGEGVPLGVDEHGNVEVGRWGEPRAIPSPKDHVDLGEGLGLMDFEAAARMSGSRFVVLRAQLARLERAIGQYMLDLQTVEQGYVEVSVPLLVRDQALFGTGQLPKFEEDLFGASAGSADGVKFLRKLRSDFERWRKGFENSGALVFDPETGGGIYAENFEQFLRESFDISEGGELVKGLVGRHPYWLIPTAEVSLTNLVREQILNEEDLPLRLTALTPCFRAEAGASGRDTRGMIRQHQFSKVELVSITSADQSEAEHERMTACAEEVLKRLELPYRKMLLCTGDMGFSARRTYDLEVWLPSQATYREISSCSNCGDFQARRMDARGRRAGEKGTRFLHTLNGSGLAVGRTLVAVMENYQDEGGKIAVPAVLQPYMGGIRQIGGEG